MTNAEKMKMCSGCRNNFYNGNNPHGIKECWSLKDAKVVRKKAVPTHQVPPWNQKPVRVLSCYHRQGVIYVNPDVTH